MKVARILDHRTVALSRGADDGIQVGMLYRIAEDVVDPESGKVIGRYPDLQVQVTEVFPRFCVGETTRARRRAADAITVNIGDSVVPDL